MALTIIKAAPGRITTFHGEDIGRGFGHVGIDVGHGDKTAADLRVVAPADGYVDALGWLGTFGNRISITHADESWSRVAHLETILVTLGQRVKQGQTIGVMGNTGGPWGDMWAVHLHQEYHLADGTAVDPLKYMGAPAGGNQQEITAVEELDMAQTRYYWKTEGGTEYGIMGAELPGGWRASTSEADGEAFGVLFGTDTGAPFAKLSRAKWRKAQEWAKKLNADYVAQQKLIHGTK